MQKIKNKKLLSVATAKSFRGGEEISSWALVKKSVKDISSYLNMKSVKEAEELLCTRIILII